MKCCNHICDLQGICLYFTLLIPVGLTSQFVETVKTLSSSKNPKSSNLSQVFLRNVFYQNSYWPCFIIGNRIRVHVIATSVYIELGMKNASPFLFVLFDQIFLGKWVHACISVLIWVSAESQELLNSSNSLLFSFGCLHCFSFWVFRKEIVALSWSCFSVMRKNCCLQGHLEILEICTRKMCIEKRKNYFKMKVTSWADYQVLN